MAENARALLKIHGHVQGVSYRIDAKRKAESLGLAGWIQNCPDKTVECLVEGDKMKIIHFIAWCYHGSELAKISQIDEDWQAFAGEFKEFSIK